MCTERTYPLTRISVIDRGANIYQRKNLKAVFVRLVSSTFTEVIFVILIGIKNEQIELSDVI